MDEMNVNAVEEQETQLEQEANVEQDDWDDIDLSDVADNDPDEEGREPDAGEADQQSQEPGQPDKAAPETGEPKDGANEADQSFTLKHLDDVYTVGKDEVIALAQKGLDYDRVKEKNAQEIRRLSVYEDFLKELAAPGNMSVEDLIDITRANILSEREGLDQEIALQRVKLDRERKDLEAQRQVLTSQQRGAEASAEEQQRMKESIDRFVKEHPNLDAKDIPQEVWEAFSKGKDLEDAYAVYESRSLKEKLAQTERELETMRQNQANKSRSTGSQTSAGSEKQTEDDLFDRMWYDGT